MGFYGESCGTRSEPTGRGKAVLVVDRFAVVPIRFLGQEKLGEGRCHEVSRLKGG